MSPAPLTSLAESHDEDPLDHHDNGPLAELVTLRDWLRYAVTRFNRANLFFGHGSDNAWDEAVYLLLHALALPSEHLEVFLDACIPTEEREGLLAIIEQRILTRRPAAYLTHEAWLGDFPFYVDERVIVPRSYFGELLEERFAPWIDAPEAVADVLDLCTGSGCLAVLCAHAFENAHVVATDLSPDALMVAERNVADYELQERIELLKSDVFSALGSRCFDLIVSNPPYVTTAAMEDLPEEYRHEPEIALAAGREGMDIIRRILDGAIQHLKPGGLLAVEVGHNRALVEAAFPYLPLTWVSTHNSIDKIFLLRREEFPSAT